MAAVNAPKAATAAVNAPKAATAAVNAPKAATAAVNAPKAATAAVKAPKAASAAECRRLEQLPNIGPALAADLRRLGIQHPGELRGRDPFQLYQALCQATGRRQDPCVLDTFMAITDFMGGAAPAAWWHYTARRKQCYGRV